MKLPSGFWILLSILAISNVNGYSQLVQWINKLKIDNKEYNIPIAGVINQEIGDAIGITHHRLEDGGESDYPPIKHCYGKIDVKSDP